MVKPIFLLTQNCSKSRTIITRVLIRLPTTNVACLSTTKMRYNLHNMDVVSYTVAKLNRFI